MIHKRRKKRKGDSGNSKRNVSNEDTNNKRAGYQCGEIYLTYAPKMGKLELEFLTFCSIMSIIF